jgi:uncharacterized protein
MGDDTYLSQPKVLSNKIMDALIDKVKIHCKETGAKEFHFAFQGGEPLLARREFYERFVDVANDALRRMAKPSFSIETNGVLLTEEWSNLFAELAIQVGLSLDGPKDIHDLYRPDLKGKGSYERAVKGLRVALKNDFHKKSLRVLSVVHPESDPLAVYAHLRQLQVSQVDFMLPAANYDTRLEGLNDHSGKTTRYADWLIAFFNEWSADPDAGRPEIGVFNRILNSFQQSEGTGGYGMNPANNALYIQTDGTIGPHDLLSACGKGFTKSGSNILTDELSSGAETALARLYLNSHTHLNKKCLACSVKEVCRGGELHTRYSSSNGFNNPSVYCHDMLKLITHIQSSLSLVTATASISSRDVMQSLSYEAALSLIDRNLSKVSEPAYSSELESFSAASAGSAFSLKV